MSAPRWFEGYGDLMTASDVAEVLGQSPKTVRNLMSRSELPGVKIGTRWYTPKTRLVEFIEEAVSGEN